MNVVIPTNAAALFPKLNCKDMACFFVCTFKWSRLVNDIPHPSDLQANGF